jgi:hypothetical protein
MAVKGKVVKFSTAPDIDQNWKDLTGGAEDIRNFRVDTNGLGWLCDRGIEPWWRAPVSYTNQANTVNSLQRAWLEKRVDSFFVWNKTNTEQVYYIVEQGGYLYYVMGNKGAFPNGDIDDDIYVISSGRHIRKVNEVGTQYIPFGNKLLIINGVDKPIWFYGGEKTRDFGFTIPTPEPQVIDIKPSYRGGVLNRLEQNTASPDFGATSPLGLGDLENNSFSNYSWKMSFILDTGAESPLSSAASQSWAIQDAAEERKFGVFISDFPVGIEGTVARKLYRTKNQRRSYDNNGRDQIFYEAMIIRDNSTTQLIDVTADSALVTEAPSLNASDIISTTYITGAAWESRMWLAGGKNHPTRIIYSDRGIPEQFGQFSYFDVGNTDGGHITGLYPFYNNLLVFRERSIDIIRSSGGAFTISNLSSNVGTTAINTIRLVPDVGVVFLSKDGFFVLTGGLDGGSAIQIRNLTNKISKEMEKVNVSALQRAFAVYSDKEKEYWCHYARRGSDIPSRGIVLHQRTGQISFRGATDKANEYLYLFTAGATDSNGNIIFGTQPTWLFGGLPSTSATVGAKGYLVNLQVWSAADYWGQQWTNAGTSQEGFNYTTVNFAPQQENIWESNWFDFGDASIKHRAFSVEVEMVTYGDRDVFLDWGYDYDATWYEAGAQKISKQEVLFTTKEDPVFNSDASITKSPFTIGQSAVKSPRKVVIRWDINTALVDTIRFRLRSTSTYHLLAYKIAYDSREQKALNQRTSVAGQPY